MKTIIYALIFLMLNCKTLETKEINLVLTNESVNKNAVIKFKLDNFSNVNYFLPLSKLDFESNFDDEELYNSIFLQPVFSDENGVVVEANNSKVIVKPMDRSNYNESLIFKKIETSDKHNKNLILLNQIVKLEKYKHTFFKQDILKYDEISVLSTSKKRYYFQKGKKYFIHFEYKLDKEYFLSKVDRKTLNKLQIEGYEPYFEKLVSNKVPFVVEEDK